MLDKMAYTEVFYIINEMSEEMKSKIPEKIMKNIQDRMDKNYEFYVDEENIENLKLLDDTEKILSVLYTDYFSTDEEKEIILNKEKIIANSRKNKEIEKIEINEIFSKTSRKTNDDIKNDINTELVNNSNMKWFEKIKKFLKNKN